MSMFDHVTSPAIDQSICDEIRLRLARDESCRVEDFVERFPAIAQNEETLLDLIYAEIVARSDKPTFAEYARRFPQIREPLVRLFEVHEACNTALVSNAGANERTEDFDVPSLVNHPSGNPRPRNAVPHSVQAEDAALIPTSSKTTDSQATTEDQFPQTVRLSATEESMRHIGRYQIRSKLGAGGFGAVYLAFDPQLQRDVAIKVSHRHAASDELIAEARNIAKLDHPGIVPAYDVGATEEGAIFIVCKYIDGENLASVTARKEISRADSLSIVAAVAEALEHAHRRGLVHRDVKPANILLERDGTPILVDFGLAIREENFGSGSEILGTVNYMSPEQAAGKSHLVDARSDIFSLGVILYELAAQQRPFRSKQVEALLHEIAHVDARPLRQIDSSIPIELDRICLKALANRPADRYATAADFAADLRRLIAHSAENDGATTAAAPQPFSPARRRIVASACLLAVMGAGLCYWLQRTHPSVNNEALTETPPPSQASSVSMPVSVPAAEPRIEIHFQRAARTSGYENLSDDALPLRDGDKIQIHAQWSQPAYAYVFWLDSQGALAPLEASATEKRTEIFSPPLAGGGELQGWHVMGGSAGIETAIVAVSANQLSDDELADFVRQASAKGRVSSSGKLNRLRTFGSSEAKPEKERSIVGFAQSEKEEFPESVRSALDKSFDGFMALQLDHR